MGIVNNLLEKFGYYRRGKEVQEHDIEQKDSSWGKLFAIGQENDLFRLMNKVTDPYKQIPSVYKAIKAISDNVSQARFQLVDRKTKEVVEGHEIQSLLESPNELMTMTDFMQAVVGYYALCGEFFIIKTESNGQMLGTSKVPAELWTFHPKKFDVIKDRENKRLTGWKYGQQRFALDEIIHSKDFDPDDDFRGFAPTKAIENIIDIDFKALVYNKAFFDNDARPGYVLTTDQSLSSVQRDRIKEWIEKHHKGASKAHKIAVLESGLKPSNVSSTHKDMDFMDQLRFSREEIIGLWRAPKALFNITDDLNYATFTGQIKVFWLYQIMPMLNRIVDAINRQLIYPIDPTVELAVDLSKVPAFQEDFANKLDSAKKLFDMGVPFNEINKKLGLGFDEFNHGRVGYLPFNLVPANELSMSSGSQDEPEKSAVKSVEKATPQNEKILKQFLRRHTKLESNFKNSLQRYFFEQRKEVLESINGKDAAPIEIRINWDEQDDKLIKRAKPYLEGATNEGIDLARRLAGDAQASEQLAVSVRSFLVGRAEKIKNINRTMASQIRSQLDAGVEAGETLDQVSDRIRHVYNVAKNRAQTIARTEITGTLNGGSVLYYDDIGVEQKQWVTAGDANVRDHHAEMDGETVRVDRRFSNGLDFPGGDGPAEEVINCRCTIVPILKGGDE